MKKNLVKGALLLSMATIGFSPALTTQAKTTPKLTQKKVTIKVGQKKKLKIKGTGKKVRWTSNKKKIVTVSPKGVLKGKKAGKAIVTAKVGKKKFKCKVTVNKGNPTLNAKSITLKKGGSYKLKVKNGTGVKWSSNNKGVATVSSKGIVKAKRTGKATITAKVGKKKLTCKVTVKKANKSDKGDTDKVNLSKEVKKQLPSSSERCHVWLDSSFNTLPLNKTIDLFNYLQDTNIPIKVTSNLVKTKYYKWFSSDPSVVSINRLGVATGHKEGKAKIHFKYMTKSGKWETSDVRTVTVKNIGNVTFSYKIGYDEELYKNSTLQKCYLQFSNTPVKFNFVNVTVTNNSSDTIEFSGVSFNPNMDWLYFKPAVSDSILLQPGETKVVLCNRVFDFDAFDREIQVNTIVDYTTVYEICFKYKVNGKLTFAYYNTKNNQWNYSQNSK